MIKKSLYILFMIFLLLIFQYVSGQFEIKNCPLMCPKCTQLTIDTFDCDKCYY